MIVNYIRGLILNLVLLALAFAKGATSETNQIPSAASNAASNIGKVVVQKK